MKSIKLTITAIIAVILMAVLPQRIYSKDKQIEVSDSTRKYELSELALEAKKANSRTNKAIGAALFLSLVVGFYFFYTKRLVEKNRALYEKVKQADEKTAEAVRQAVKDIECPGIKLFRHVNSLMAEKKLFKDPGLNRESLANAAGTNSKYLADAVKEFGEGRTVNELINWWRLQEAAEILGKDPSMPVVQVGEKSGFGSSQTFYRLFKEHFGMTPSDYRDMILRSRN